MADWKESGGHIECNAPGVAMPQIRSSERQMPGRRLSWLEVLASWPLERLIGCWLGMILGFGIIYWLAGISMGWGLQAGSAEVKPDLRGFGTAIYFSFVT